MQLRKPTLTLLRRFALPAFQSLTTVSKRVSIYPPLFYPSRKIRHISIRSSSSQHGARLSHVHQLILESEERAKSAAAEPPPPKLSLEHVNMSFARSGGSGGQNVNKVNTKVDMRFNVKKATWLSERIRDKILVLEKNRINKEGEIVISSTKTRTQQGNIEDCLKKLQAIIDAAAYVPPPPSEEQKKKIAQLAAKSEQKRAETKKALSQKKQFRRNKGSWD